MEREIETGAMAVEAFDFFILYTAWLSRQDTAIFQERAERGEKPAPLRNAMSVEHDVPNYQYIFEPLMPKPPLISKLNIC
jgi:hypothetical protein